MAAIQQPKTVPETPVSASHTESGKKSSLSSILEQIDSGANSRDSQTSTGAGMSALNSFIAAVTDEYVKKPASRRNRWNYHPIEVLMSRQLDEIMHAKPFLGWNGRGEALNFLSIKREQDKGLLTVLTLLMRKRTLLTPCFWSRFSAVFGRVTAPHPMWIVLL